MQARNNGKSGGEVMPANPLEQLAPRHTLDEVCAIMRSMRMSGLEAELRRAMEDPGFTEMSFIDQLHTILAAEGNRRGFLRYERNRKAAGIPLSVSREATRLAASGIDGLTRAQRSKIGNCAWESESLIIIIGKSGSGKSTLAASMADLMLRKGRRVLYRNYTTALFTMGEFLANGCMEAWRGELDALTRNDFLILDDAFLNDTRKCEASSLKELIDRSRDTGCCLILCTQLAPTEWHQHLRMAGGGVTDTNTADAVADRLSSDACFIRLNDSTHRDRPCRVVDIGGDGSDGGSDAAS